MPDRSRRDGRARDCPSLAVARGAPRPRRERDASPGRRTASRRGSSRRPGYEFDPFRISGLPRRPGSTQAAARPCSRGRAPRRCARILAARRPGRRARRRRLRRRADGRTRRGAKHDPGRADRGRRAPRAREPAGRAVRAAGLPRVSDRGARRRAATASSGARCRRAAAVPREEARRAVRAAGGRAGAARLRRQPGRRGAERGRRSRPSARTGRRCSTSAASATTRRCAGGSRGRTTALLPWTDDFGARARRGRPRARARGRLGVGGRRRRQAGRARPLAERHRRPPDEERALLRGRRAARSSCPRPSSARVPELVRALLGDRGRLAEMGEAMRRARRPDAADEIAEELIALALRLRAGGIWLVGIGGAGISAYALARAGVGGRGRRLGSERDAVPRAGARGRDRRARSRRSRRRPTGWEVVRLERVSGRCPGRPRAELLAELVSLRPSIVVAGAHGKTTTAAMIAFALRETGRDPSWIVGGEVPQLGGERRRGGGLARRRGRRVRPLGRARCARGSPSSRTSTSTTTRRSPRAAEVEELFDRWLAEVPDVVRGWELEPVDFAARRAGRAQPPERGGRARRRSSWRASRAAKRSAALAPVRGRRAAVRARRARRGGVAVYDDYAHNPAEAARGDRDRAGARADGRVLVLFQPHLYSRTRHLARELGPGAGGRRRGRRHGRLRGARGAGRGSDREARRRRALRRPAGVRAGLDAARSRTRRASSRAGRAPGDVVRRRSAPVTSTARSPLILASWRRCA